MSEEAGSVKRLYRSRQNRLITGVAGGLANYFNLDANIVRILFVVFTFFGGIGAVVYIAALIILPENTEEEIQSGKPDKDKTRVWGLVFIVLGLALFFREIGLFDYFWFWNFQISNLWAIFLIVIGITLIITANKPAKSGSDAETATSTIPDFSKLNRSDKDRMLAGVCAGIAEYYKIDPSIVRILWVIGTFASLGLGIIIYLVLIFILLLNTGDRANQ